MNLVYTWQYHQFFKKIWFCKHGIRSLIFCRGNLKGRMICWAAVYKWDWQKQNCSVAWLYVPSDFCVQKAMQTSYVITFLFLCNVIISLITWVNVYDKQQLPQLEFLTVCWKYTLYNKTEMMLVACLGTFTKFQKAIISFIVSVCPH